MTKISPRLFLYCVLEMDEDDVVEAELKWPDASRLTKPDGSTSAVWTHFRCEYRAAPDTLKGKMASALPQ
jgi:hypothetical protein